MVDGARQRGPPAAGQGGRPIHSGHVWLARLVKDTSHQMQPPTLNCQVVAALAMRAMAAKSAGERQGALDQLETLPLGSWLRSSEAGDLDEGDGGCRWCVWAKVRRHSLSSWKPCFQELQAFVLLPMEKPLSFCSLAYGRGSYVTSLGNER